jgi:hypothetical protein
MRRIFLVLGALAAVAACDSSGGGEAAAPLTSVSWTDSVQLQEADSLFVASASSITVHADGRMVVGDARAKKVVVFDAQGRPLVAFGGPGRGPGEFVVPSVVEVVDDSTVAVLDPPAARVSRFNIADGAFVHSARSPGQAIDMRASAAALWVAAPQVATEQSFARWDLVADSLTLHGTVPASYTRFPRLRRNMGLGMVAATDSGVWVGMLGSNALDFYALNALVTPTRSIEVPRLRRRGVPLDKPELFDKEVAYEEELHSVSMLMSLAQLSDGRLATLHYDFTVVDETFNVAAFLSVIDAKTGAGCIDLAVPAVSETQPMLRLIGDRLYFVQAVPDGEDGTATWVKWVDVGALQCS